MHPLQMNPYENLDALGMVSDLHTWKSSESPLFVEFIEEAKPKTIIEVGAWKGVSALIWADLSKEFGAHVHTVDTFLGSYEHHIHEPALVPRDPWGGSKLYHQFLVNVKNAGFDKRITPYQMTSRDGAKVLKHIGIRAQIISIDASHDPTDVYHDIKDYWELLDEGGLMVGDDMLVFPGVFAAALRFAAENNFALETRDPFWVIRKGKLLWPADYNLSRDHCGDVLRGEYNLPYEKENMRILDIGANVGAFARWAKKRWPDSTINCYEPHPVNFFLLKRTVKDFKLQGVEIHEMAVAHESGTHDFHHNGPNSGEWSLSENAGTHDKMTVRTMAARDLPDADFIKIDTEGAEPEILLSLAHGGKLVGVSCVVLEYHAATMIRPLQDLMEANGFRLVESKSYMEHRGIQKYTR